MLWLPLEYGLAGVGHSPRAEFRNHYPVGPHVGLVGVAAEEAVLVPDRPVPEAELVHEGHPVEHVVVLVGPDLQQPGPDADEDAPQPSRNFACKKRNCGTLYEELCENLTSDQHNSLRCFGYPFLNNWR